MLSEFKFVILLNTVGPTEADTAEDQQDFPTVISEDMMKLGLMENNTVILQVEEDHSSLPPPRQRRISQSDVLEEQHKALKLQQEMVDLKKVMFGFYTGISQIFGQNCAKIIGS